MRGKRFQPAQISTILQAYDNGKDVIRLFENTEYLRLRFISGVKSIKEWIQHH